MSIIPTRAIPFILRQGAPYQHNVEVKSGDGAILSVAGGVVFITKGSAAALTLAAPANDGARLVIISTTAFAHTVTVAGGIAGAGASADVGTFGAAAGNGVTLISYNGLWYVEPGTNQNVTFA
jgi:hypothetical protein